MRPFTIIFKYLGLRQRNAYGYIDAKETISKAEAAGKTICEYVEEMWGEIGETDRILSELANLGVLSPYEEVCEIGPGTGKFLERILLQTNPKKYHIYETDDGWAKYLEKTYNPKVIKHQADGRTLKGIKNQSCGLVTAFGVFVYLPALQVFGYFDEMVRICKEGGYIVFDFYQCDNWTTETVKKWQNEGSLYPVLLPKRLILEYFELNGFHEIGNFRKKHGADFSDYLVLKKTRSQSNV